MADGNQSLLRRARRLLDDVSWASARYGVSRRAIVAHLARLYRLHHVRPLDAHREGLSNPQVPAAQLRAVITKPDLLRLQGRLNPRSHISVSEDKALFYAYCRAVGLPIPAFYAVVDRPIGWLCDGTAVAGAEQWAARLRQLHGHLIVKPAAGVYGHGVRAYTRAASGFETPTGEVLTESELAASLLADPWRRLVVQERLENHPAIGELTHSRTLQTVRIRTLVRNSGQILAGAGIMKIAGGQSVCDNLEGGRTGNFVAPIGSDGRLQTPAAYARSGRGIEVVERHPLSSRPLPGFPIPYWDEAKNLVRRAAALFLPVRTVGWDVAITPGGAALVEANPWWDPGNLLLAVPSQGSYAEEMAALLDAMRAEARAEP